MANIYDMVDTWNDGATEFTSVKMNATDTASAASSKLIDLQVGGVPKFKVDKNGNLTLGGEINIGHATDTTIERASAGQISVEGVQVATATNTLTLTNKTLTSPTINGGAIGSPVTGIREQLTAARTYYVRTDGNDANTGLADTAGGAFLTLNKAIGVAVDLDPNGYAVTIRLGTGTFSAASNVLNMTQAMLGNAALTITGDTTTASSHVLTVTGYHTANISAGKVVLKDLTLTGTGTGSRLNIVSGAVVELNNVRFGGTSRYHIEIVRLSQVMLVGPTEFFAGCVAAIYMAGGSILTGSGQTTTVTGTPAFSNAFIVAQRAAGYDVFDHTYTGSATGKRYNAGLNGVIFTYAKGPDYFPGDVAGTTATGGQYG